MSGTPTTASDRHAHPFLLNRAVITGTDEKAAQYNSIDDLQGSKIGISRIGSGSQIMASVMALQQ